MQQIQQPVALQFSEVSCSIGGNPLLSLVSFSIHQGEFVYLVGKTGSGKSSLLRLIYADLALGNGQITLGSTAVAGLERKQIPVLRRQLGIVFQDFQLLPDRTVAQNLLFAMRATGWKERPAMEARLNELMVEFGLKGKERQFPYQLSGGEQQLVSIARALVNDPLLLLADEPTGNLDPSATKVVMQALRKVVGKGTTVLMATHEYGLLRDYPGKVLWLKEGSVQEFVTSSGFLEVYSG